MKISEEIVWKFLEFKDIGQYEFDNFVTIYDRAFNHGIREASEFVREWAMPMDVRQECTTKSLINEIADHISELEY